MLQQILNSSNKIESLPEPWLMLPMAQLLKQTKHTSSSYNYHFFQVHFDKYIKDVKDGKAVLLNAIRQYGLDLYGAALKKEDNFFLDKTPRYYHIIGELIEVFPNARIVLLVRNPLSVFSSILSYNFDGKISGFKNEPRICDLLLAPKEILKLKQHPGVFFINYEDIVSRPQEVLPKLFEYIGISQDANQATGTYQVDEIFASSKLIDRKSATKHNKPVEQYLTAWKKSIKDKQQKQLALQYIETLGEDTLSRLGYSYQEVIQSIKEHPVKFCIPTISFQQLTGNTPEILKKGLLFFYRVQKKIWL